MLLSQASHHLNLISPFLMNANMTQCDLKDRILCCSFHTFSQSDARLHEPPLLPVVSVFG